MGKCAKSAPCYYEPFEVLQRVGSSACRLLLPQDVQVHPVFQVSHLKELLGSNNDTLEYLSYKPHEPKRILNVRTKNLHSKSIREYKIKWLDCSIEDATPL